ncbi:hypothetical protein HIU97_03880 [Enterococcus casseliflavus]|uniref:hypothetical protein n=1 Tax=Enterococcus casseliflavus TaxID=37734 RepID=UPI001C43813E|nr:hypothetical protein [Enterococcus casseliflavus]MBV6373882.1 hypothetical protein [Enterococcus casseliflavus]
MQSRSSKSKNKGKNAASGCLGCLGIIFAIFIIAFALTSGNSDENSKANQTYTEQLTEKFGKETTVVKEGESIVIDIPSSSSGNIFVNVGFPQDVAEALKIVQKEKFEKVLVREISTLSDNKGNQKEGTLAAAMFDNETIQSINFDNWVSQVTGDSTAFYDLSNAYYILPSAFKDNDKKIINEYAKGSSDPLWTKYLF